MTTKPQEEPQDPMGYNQQTSSTTTTSEGCVCPCVIQVQVITMKIPYRATSSAQKGDRPILEYTTKWSSPD